MSAPAYFLVTHGSRDRRSFTQLQALVDTAQKLEPHKIIGGGCLEGLEFSLEAQLVEFGKQVLNLGGDRLFVIPVFLLPGVHVCEDLPAEVELAQTKLANLTLAITPYLGSHPQIPQILDGRFPSQGQRILITHGSKRSGGNQMIEQIAAQIQAIAAYWSVSPSLDSQLTTLIEQAVKDIRVMPYFLFPGGITEAIAKIIEKFREEHPESPAQITLLSTPLTLSQIATLALELPTCVPTP